MDKNNNSKDEINIHKLKLLNLTEEAKKLNLNPSHVISSKEFTLEEKIKILERQIDTQKN